MSAVVMSVVVTARTPARNAGAVGALAGVEVSSTKKMKRPCVHVDYAGYCSTSAFLPVWSLQS